MATVSEALGAAGAPHELTLDGTAVRFSLITQKVKSEFERWLYQRAVQGLIAMKEIAGPMAMPMVSSALATIANDLSAGKYAWNGAHYFEAMQTLSGMCKLLSLLSRDPSGRAVPAERFEEWLTGNYSEEIGHLFKVIFEESLPKKDQLPKGEASETKETTETNP